MGRKQARKKKTEAVRRWRRRLFCGVLLCTCREPLQRAAATTREPQTRQERVRPTKTATLRRPILAERGTLLSPPPPSIENPRRVRKQSGSAVVSSFFLFPFSFFFPFTSYGRHSRRCVLCVTESRGTKGHGGTFEDSVVGGLQDASKSPVTYARSGQRHGSRKEKVKKHTNGRLGQGGRPARGRRHAESPVDRFRSRWRRVWPPHKGIQTSEKKKKEGRPKRREKGKK